MKLDPNLVARALEGNPLEQGAPNAPLWVIASLRAAARAWLDAYRREVREVREVVSRRDLIFVCGRTKDARLLRDAGFDARELGPNGEMPECWGLDVVLVGCDPARTGHLRRGAGLEPIDPSEPGYDDPDDRRPRLIAVLSDITWLLHAMAVQP